MQNEAFGLDSLRALAYTGCDMHLEAGLARCARHRQAVEQEREVLVRDVE